MIVHTAQLEKVSNSVYVIVLFLYLLIFSISVMQIFRFSANFADFVAKKVIFVNRLNPLRQFKGIWEALRVHNTYLGYLYETNR